MKLIGFVEASERVGMNDLDILLENQVPLLCVVKTEEFVLTGKFTPTKWGGEFGTGVVGYLGQFVDAEDESTVKDARLLYNPDESKQWQLYFVN